MVAAPSFEIGHCLSNLLITFLFKVNRLTESFGLYNGALKFFFRSSMFFSLNCDGNFRH